MTRTDYIDYLKCNYSGDIVEDAFRIRSELKLDPNVIVKMKCLNEEEAHLIKACLSDEERRRTFFTWLGWGVKST